jgi:hypothetical protein
MNNKYILIMKEKIYTILNHAKTSLAYKSPLKAPKIEVTSTGRVKSPPSPKGNTNTTNQKWNLSWGTPH